MRREDSEVKQNQFADYLKRATELVMAWTGSRSGFGAMLGGKGGFSPTAELICESSFFNPRLPRDVVAGMFDMGSNWYRAQLVWQRLLFDEILTTPESFRPFPIWSLFWSMAKAEHRFLNRFLPFWSHEERLTGHLVSQMMERFKEFSTDWQGLARIQCQDNDSSCAIIYADTSANRQEALTGSDFAVIFDVRFPKHDPYLKVVRFQAKKACSSSTAIVDLQQLRQLLKTDRLVYFLFYHACESDAWSLPPTVMSAADVQKHLDKAEQERNRKGNAETVPTEKGKGTIKLNEWPGQYDFASFLTFAQADPRSEHGIFVRSATEAIRTACSGPTPDGSDGPPRRILVFTLGEPSAADDWPEQLRHVPSNIGK